MPILIKINWVDISEQPEPHQRIRHIGGDSNQLKWKHTQAQAIEFIERDEFVYYVEKDARVLSLEIGRTADGKKYLTIRNDGGDPQLLLTLPGCPDSAPANPAAL